jgi:hypothetical protein
MFVEDMDIDGADVEHAVSKTSLQDKALQHNMHYKPGKALQATVHLCQARQLCH